MSEPVSPADTIRRVEELREKAARHGRVVSAGDETYSESPGWNDVLFLLAVGERDKAAHLGPVPTDAGGPGKEETYWLTRKLKASIRHLRDIEDYYRPMGGRFSEERADRARVLYEQITADFLNGKMTAPPEIVALRAAGERDRQQIARLTEALERSEWGGSRWLGMETCPICGAERTQGHTRNCLARAVLADEEDAGA